MEIFQRSLVVLFLISFSGSIRSQDLQDSAALEIKKKISPAHQLIPGTHIYLIPPSGFTKSQIFTGLEHDATGYIKIQEAGKPFDMQEKQICDDQEIMRDGGRIIDQHQIPLNGYSARYTLLQKDPAFMLILICLGDTGFSAFIQARFKSYDEQILESVKSSLFSIVYDRLRAVTPFEEAFFIIDYASSPFIPKRIKAGSYYFTPKETIEEKNAESNATLSWFNINQTTTAIGIADDNLLKEYQVNNDQTMIRRVSTRLINGHDALEREIYISENGKRFLLYQGVILFTDKAIMLQGYAYERFGENLEVFRNMLSSVRSR